jgi:hypothetical protein
VSTSLATTRQTYPIDRFQPLDKYQGGLSNEQPRVPWLATISAGYTDTSRDPPIPRASRQADAKWIHMTPEDSLRAPGLRTALELRDYRWLEIAVPFDDPSQFIQQRFEKRSASRLEMHGDEHQLTEIVVREVRQNNRTVLVPEPRRVHPAGSAEYARLVEQCSVSVSVFFVLSYWKGSTPTIHFPDGLGVYRLRFTSRHSLRSIWGSLKQLSGLTGGRLAGLPLRLTLEWREVADPTGHNRMIGVWTPRFVPPAELELTPRLWQNLAGQALAEGEAMRLPLPAEETVEDAAQTLDVDLDAPPPSALAELKAGPRADARYYQQAWFAAVKGSPLDSEEARAQFLWTFSEGRTDSLMRFLEQASDAEASALMVAARRAVEAATAPEQRQSNARRYAEIYGTDDDDDDQVVDLATGEILPVGGPDPDPEPGEPLAPPPEQAAPDRQDSISGKNKKQPPVTVRSPIAQRFAELVEEAARLEVAFDDLKLQFPAEHEDVVRKGEKLRDRIEAKKQALAEPQRTAEPSQETLV